MVNRMPNRCLSISSQDYHFTLTKKVTGMQFMMTIKYIVNKTQKFCLVRIMKTFLPQCLLHTRLLLVSGHTLNGAVQLVKKVPITLVYN